MRKQNILKIIILIFVITLVIVGAKRLVPQSKAQENTNVNINYISEENTSEINQTLAIDKDTNSVVLLDFLTEGTENWQHSDIVDGEVLYEASFAGWKLVSINNTTITEEYIYPDNDYIYFNDEPFDSFPETITDLKFEALWGKTVYVRDKYNFVDIKNIYGYNVEGSTGDILTAKINWDTSVTYSSDDNSGATKDEPVSTIEKAYELLKDSYGGKICIVNHITLEQPEEQQAYSSSFKNAAYTYVYTLGNNLNISGVVTISGKDLGSGTEVENKANQTSYYTNSYIYVKNTRGAGTYNGQTYKSPTIQIRLYTNTVFEDFSYVSYRENYNSNGARQTSDTTIYNTANKRLVIEETFKGYKRTTSQSKLGLETGNFSHTNVQGTVNGSTVNFSALSTGLSSCTHIYGAYYSYTKDGSTYTVNKNDNIYLNLRGGTGWYNIVGLGVKANASIKINNLHLNVDDLNCSVLYGTYQGTISSAKDLTFNLNNIGGTTVSPTSNCSVTAENVNMILTGDQTKKITTMYAGGYNTATDGAIKEINAEVNVKINGAKITNLYGGGNQVATLVLGKLNFNILSGNITNLYGGGLGGYIGSTENKTDINLNISGGTISYIYGGGSGGFVSLYVSNGPMDLSTYTQSGQYFYKGSEQYYATTRATYTNSLTKFDDAKFIVKEYAIKSGETVLNTYTSIYSETIYPNGADTAVSNYYRTRSEYTISDALVNGNITINLNDGANILNDVYGGGKNGAVNGDITINVADGAKIGGNVYGGGEGLQSTILGNISGIDFMWTNLVEDKVIDIAEFEEAAVQADTIFSLAPEAGNYTTKFLIGKEMKENFLQSDNYIYVYSETISKLGLIGGNTSINVEGGDFDTIYGGSNGSVASVSGNTAILIKNGNINNIYGGGNAGEVGNTSITINGGTIKENVYGGGNVAKVKGNTELYISSGAFTNIFGGGNQSYIEGNTLVNVGDETNAGITVTGLVYGGGRGYDADSDGDASDFTTVYGSSEVDIQGTNTNVENYGSIKLGAVAGDVDVVFKDYWTGNNTAKYKTMNGIDRATTVTFNNSYVLLENKDANNNLEGIKAIGNLVIPEGSGLKISADGEITGNFEGGGELYLDSEVCLTVGGDITGVTKLVLNPILFADTNINMIKGGIENPYLKVAGQSQATTTEAASIELVSGEKRYDILAKKQEENGTTYSYYYIAGDIDITDYIDVKSTSVRGRRYNLIEETQEGININSNEVFTTQINLHYELLSDAANPNKYTQLSRQIALKINAETSATIPKGTEILMIKDDKLYDYIVEADTDKIELNKFKDISNQVFPEVNNLTTADGVTAEINPTTQSIAYRYDEKYTFIINFVNAETRIQKGTYYVMMNINDDDTWINEEQVETANTIKVKDVICDYTYSLDKQTYEANGIINISSTLKIEENVDINRSLFTVIKLADANGNIIDIPDGSKIYLDNQECSGIQNGVAQIKITESFGNTTVTQSINLSIDMSGVVQRNMLENGNYNLILEFISTLNGDLESIVQKVAEIPIVIQSNAEKIAEYGLEAKIDQTVENIQLINKNNTETRTISLQYKGTLEQPKIKIKVLEKTGPFEYTNTENANKITAKINQKAVTEITEVVEEQTISVSFEEGLNSGTYRVVFELYDNQENKLTESLINFIVTY